MLGMTATTFAPLEQIKGELNIQKNSCDTLLDILKRTFCDDYTL